ncbi:MAG: leucine-rich repeat domain-containing protein [Candidatus Hydrogenedentes bacterium]|jgi:hypothetical protein|nr:leucine-rich repeat domain-containing protein [Candidatus Hydrogenedentota bacterium]
MGMTLKRFGRCMVLAVVLTAGLTACSPIVFIPDQALESVLRADLGKPLSLFLTKADLAKVDDLDAAAYNIDSLEGLQYCVNLRKLNLSNNQVHSIDPLAGLTKLTYLHLGNNYITDIEALAGMLALDYLNLGGENNAIVDWGYLQDNVLNGGLNAGSVVVVPDTYTRDSEGNALPGFSSAYNAMLDAGVIVEFVSGSAE